MAKIGKFDITKICLRFSKSNIYVFSPLFVFVSG